MKWGRAGRFLVYDYPWAARARLTSARHRRPPVRWAEGDGAPVLLIPGVYETWHFLKPIGDRLADAGHPVVALPQLGRNAAPIAATAARVWAEVVRRDLRGVIIVAHSKGGLIGKHLLAIDDTESRIDRMVAVATPFGGSSLARLAPNPALRAFRASDPLLVRLASERAVDARITSVYPVLDPHIPEGSRLEGARNVPLRMGGHFGPIFEPAAIAVVLAEVARSSAAR